MPRLKEPPMRSPPKYHHHDPDQPDGLRPILWELWKRCLERLAEGLEDPKRRFNPAFLAVVIAFLKMNDVRVTKADRSTADALRNLKDAQATLAAMNQPF